jgi:hypothetical protein
MEEVVRVWVRRVLVVVLAAGALALGSAAPTFSKEKPKSPTGSATKDKTSDKKPSENVNACGCYRNDSGGCICTDKKGKCECPGECEPVGCAEKRDKEIEREMAAEIKRAQDEEKKREEAQKAQENGTATPDAGEAAPPAVAAKPSKTSRKNAAKGQDKADKPEKVEKK